MRLLEIIFRNIFFFVVWLFPLKWYLFILNEIITKRGFVFYVYVNTVFWLIVYKRIWWGQKRKLKKKRVTSELLNRLSFIFFYQILNSNATKESIVNFECGLPCCSRDFCKRIKILGLSTGSIGPENGARDLNRL